VVEVVNCAVEIQDTLKTENQNLPYPNDLIAHLDLIVAYEELGRDQDARAEIPEVMRINPHFVLPPPETSWFKDVALNKRWEGELRKAGLK
jgi:hypothetical protein